jgi:hypothetical protein
MSRFTLGATLIMVQGIPLELLMLFLRRVMYVRSLSATGG